MNVVVHELMTDSVVTTEPHATISHARNVMEGNEIGALPVGIVSITDCVSGLVARNAPKASRRRGSKRQ